MLQFDIDHDFRDMKSQPPSSPVPQVLLPVTPSALAACPGHVSSITLGALPCSEWF